MFGLGDLASDSFIRQDLRKMAASYMRTHPDDYMPFVIEVCMESTTILATAKPGTRNRAANGHVCDLISLMAPLQDCDDPSAEFEKYCSDVEDTATWGGQVPF